MITCDKCGFGHKTFEEKRACKSWDEIAAELKVVPAATREQPAGSEAPPALTVEQVLATYQGICWEDQTPSGLNRGWLEFTQRLNAALALSPYHCTYCDGNHFEKDCPQRCGSPRKVGEAGPLEDLLKVFDGVSIRFGLAAQGHIPTVEKMLYEGKTWNEIGSVIGWHGPTAKEHYKRYLLRSSSVPVGEQKQGEGV